MGRSSREEPYDRMFYYSQFVSASIAHMTAEMGHRHHYPDLTLSWNMLLGAEGKTGLSNYIVNSGDPFCSVAALSSLYMHHAFGQQTYVVNEEMHDLFLRTDLTNVTLDDLELPNKCIYVAVPPGKYQLWGGSRTGWHDCDGVFLRKRMYYEIPQEIELALGVKLAAVNEWSDIEEQFSKLGMTYEDLATHQETGFIMNATGYPSAASERFDDDAQAFSCLSACDWTNPEYAEGNDPPNAERFLRAKLFNGSGRPRANPEFRGTDPDIMHRSNEMLFDLYKVAFNAVVYMNNGLATKTVQRQNRRELENFTALYHTAGTQSKRDTYGRKATRLAARPTVHILGVGLEKNDLTGEERGILVRGHWHTYLVGPGRQRRELRWLQPYIRTITTTGAQ